MNREVVDGDTSYGVRRTLEFELPSESYTLKEELNIVDGPKIGMEFLTEESAHNFYNAYARKVGFSIRKDSTKKINGVIIKRQFCCSKQGQKSDIKEVSYNRAITRTNCSAGMAIQIHSNGKFVVYKFEQSHNHELVTPSKVHMLRSQRIITDAQKGVADMADDSGITPKATMEFLGRQAGGRENLGFQPIDYKNYLHKKRMKDMEKGDAGAVLQYFQKKQVEDPLFFYTIQLDEDDQITNIFWADGKSIIDYNYFGDVVCFDTTYRVNSYGRPFAPFVGVNHHKQTIIFGAALLYDETKESFKWLFEAFLSAMSGKKPITILTDQCAAMSSAIEIALQGTFHRLCVWHIFQNAAKHLSNIFHGSKSFLSDFSMCVYEYEEEEEFLNAWGNMLVKYELTENKWLKDLFLLRKKWALVYGRNTFCADMKSTQRSESMNHVLKKYLNSKYDLLRFFKNYERVLADLRYNESAADFKMRQSAPRLFANVKMLKEASILYTPSVFEVFQKEYEKFLSHELIKCDEWDTISQFQVITSDKNARRIVKFDSSKNKVTCSCKKFEFMGILCSHALKVLDFYNVKALPPDYILKRWHRDAKFDIVKDNHEVVIEGDNMDASGKRYSSLCRSMIGIAKVAAETDETFKFAQKYCEHFHDGVIECMKKIKEVSLHSSRAIDESINVEGVDPQQSEQGFIYTGNVGSQPVSGIKIKPKVRGGRRAFQNPLEKGSKKKCRSKSNQPLYQEEAPLETQGIPSQCSFQSPYPSLFSLSTQFNQGSYIPMVDPYIFQSGSSGIHQCMYEQADAHINYQHNPLVIRSQESFATSSSHLGIHLQPNIHQTNERQCSSPFSNGD